MTDDIRSVEFHHNDNVAKNIFHPTLYQINSRVGTIKKKKNQIMFTILGLMIVPKTYAIRFQFWKNAKVNPMPPRLPPSKTKKGARNPRNEAPLVHT